jgi:predicted O-methyltransferase YrrM
MIARDTYLISEEVANYVREFSAQETDLLRRLREETARLPEAEMQISPDQAQFFRVLLKSIHAKKALEIGVFTGYSGLVTASALPGDGQLIACDISEEFTSTARRYWKEAGVANKIDLRLGPAIQTLERLLAEGHAGTFDFAFIDAAKTEYDAYYELSLKLVRSGGLIALDNMLWRGRVVDPGNKEAGVRSIRELNQKIHSDTRVIAALVPVFDGVSLVYKI